MNFYKMFFLLLLLSSCSPATKSTKFQTHTPSTLPNEIKFFLSKLPICEYEEIGIVSSSKRWKWISMDEVVYSLKEEAHVMGGDAIIQMSEDSQIKMVTEHGNVIYKNVLSGTVIRFTDRGCMK